MKSLTIDLLSLAAAAAVVSACFNMKISELKAVPDLAYAKGVSAPFCGVVQDALVVAGGANFPDKPLLEGGQKRVYADIWVKAPGFWKSWKRAGHLPDSTAYGATFQLGDALVLAGGNAAGQTTDKVYELRISYGRAVLRTLPQLPVPLEQAGWTRDGNRLFLAGGTSGPAGSAAVYTCIADDYRWTHLLDLPEPLVQPVAFAAENMLYVWGGFNPVTLEVSDRGWCINLDEAFSGAGTWREAPSVPDGGSFVGAAGATLPDCRLVVVGGVNREIFARALHNTPEDRISYLSQKPSDYRFRQAVYLFDPATEEWNLVGSAPPCALAGPGLAVRKAYDIYVVGGELKPGVRSPKIFELKW